MVLQHPKRYIPIMVDEDFYPDVLELLATKYRGRVVTPVGEEIVPAPPRSGVGWPQTLVYRAVRESVNPLAHAWDLWASKAGTWVSTEESRAATGQTVHQFRASLGQFTRRSKRIYERDDWPIETVKQGGAWHFRLNEETAETVRRARSDMPT